MGKFGAFVGGYAFKPLVKQYGIARVLNLCGLIAVLGLLLTSQFTPETKDIHFDTPSAAVVNECGDDSEPASRAYGLNEEDEEKTSLLNYDETRLTASAIKVDNETLRLNSFN